MDRKKLEDIFRDALGRLGGNKSEKPADLAHQLPPLKISLEDKFPLRNELQSFDVKKIPIREELEWPHKKIRDIDFFLPPIEPHDYFSNPSGKMSPRDHRDFIFHKDDNPWGSPRDKLASVSLRDLDAALQTLELLMLAERLREASSVQRPQTAEERQQWLEEHIGRLEVVQAGKDYIAALPDSYEMDYSVMSKREQSMALLESLAGVETTPMRCMPKRVEVSSDSREDSIGKLYSRVAQGLDIRTYNPKAGQDSSILVNGKEYVVIRREHPLHDHSSTDLIDFVFCDVDPLGGRVQKGSLEGKHSHLIDPRFTL